VKYLLIFAIFFVPGGAKLVHAGQSSTAASAPAPSVETDAQSASRPKPQEEPGAPIDKDSNAGRQSNTQNQASDAGAALDFLGSYSAPQAVLATETGHTSSRPPSVSADRRLADLGSDFVPADAAEARRKLVGTLASANHSPDDWFRAGTVALGAARADSRRLAEIAPSSDWNRRFQADRPISPSEISHLRDELESLSSAPENPETLYRRARLLVEISGAAYKLAAVSPALDARLFALQALAAEEENDEGAALAEYRAGLAKYPESGLLHAGLGHLYRERNELQPARAELDQAERLLPSDPLVAFDLGDVELRMGEPARALEVLNRALELDSSLLVARWSRGRAYLALGGDDNNRRALADLEAAVSCDTSGVLQWQLGQLYTKLGRNQEARQAEQKSLDQRRAAEQQKRAAEVKSP
jgi:Tfp pilus assembly protein PilF